MKLLFKFFILSRAKEEGFVLPIIISLGLIMTLLGTVSIFQSSDEQLTATSQRETAKALAAAEIGVARYRELIDSNKVIAVYDACTDINANGDTDDSEDWGTGTDCNNPDSQVNWANSNIPNINASCLRDPDNPDDTPAEIVANMATRSWRAIDPDAPEEGQYRLVDYSYSSPNDLGTLTVEGRVGQNNTNVDNDPLAAVTQVVVDLPIQRGIPTPNGEAIELEGNFNNFHPALWITRDNERVIDKAGLKVDGNIVMTDTDDCLLTGNPVMDNDNLNNTETQSVIVTPIQPIAKTFPLPGITTLDVDTDVDVNAINASAINSGITLPRPGDLSEHQDSNSNSIIDLGEEVIYHYLVTGDINITNQNIKIRAGRKVILYVAGNITFRADGAGSSVDINSDNPSYYLEIYGSNADQTISFEGNGGEINLKALIHAPRATVEINNNPIVNITGAVWVKDWDGNDNLSTEVTIMPDSNASDPDTKKEEISEQYYNYTYIREDLVGTNARVVDPVVEVPSRWETQQAK